MLKLLFLLGLLCLTSLFIGVSELSPALLLGGDSQSLDLLFTSRLPRLLSILLAGAGLSVAGLVMQQISQNRFAAPSTTGTIECAMLGYMLSLVLFGNGSQLWLIFSVSILGTLLFVTLINRIQFRNAVFVPLIGIIYGSIVSSCATFLAYKYDALQMLDTWAMANFASILKGNFELLYIALPIAVFTYVYAARISAVGMGRDFAIGLGLSYQQVMVIGVMLVSVLSASVVMIVGTLPFLGLLVPNIVSLFYGDNLRRNIPRVAVLGALLVLVCDITSRLIIFPYEVPVSMLVSILGGLAFIYLVVKGPAHVG